MPSINNYRNLTPEQQRLINMYINQYNQTNTHIDLLLDMLDEIRGNIINVINNSQPRRTRINRHSRNSNLNINRIINQFFNDTQNSNVYYDYNNPINPSIYNDFNNINDNNDRSPIRENTNINRNTTTSNNINNANRSTNNNFSTLDNNIFNIFETFLNSTVIVRPTTEQIENSSRLIRYGDIENPLLNSCPISLEEFHNDDEVRQLLPCGHIFYPSPFQQWFSEHVRCPVCRYDIRNYRPLSRRNTPNNETSGNSQPNPSNNTSTPNISNSNEETNNNSTTSSFSNVNILRDPISNQADYITFDINDQQFTNNFLDRFARNIFQTIINPNTHNNERIMIDPSNNILFYETIIRPRSNNENNN